ncbi:DUF3605 domain-containing protein [Microdochium nivale]|nr:DUF3605 domain-containing protein [Microdochium nivale]
MGSLTTDKPALPYWQVNVPEGEREAECPEFLQDMSPKDEEIVGTPDAEYRIASWSEVRRIVAANDLAAFRRVPSQLRRYREYSWKLRRDYGSVMRFVLSERLGWETGTADTASKKDVVSVSISGGDDNDNDNDGDGDDETCAAATAEEAAAAHEPFTNDDDVKVLWNDWPYGIDPRIVHLVVWTKFDLEEDPATGDLTATARQQIDDYVRETFGRGRGGLPRDRYIWFKNWRSLKSIQAVEHFHVMLFDPDLELVRDVTNGDVPLCNKV